MTRDASVFIALGSNLGDRQKNLQDAIAALTPAVLHLNPSPIYETVPWGFLDQPRFLNQVLGGETALSPSELLSTLKQVEIDLGRQPGIRYGPRLIDLDILFYDDLVLDQPGLSIPHPRLAERAFVLVPLAALVPHLRHPVTGKTVQEMLTEVDTSGVQLYQA